MFLANSIYIFFLLQHVSVIHSDVNIKSSNVSFKGPDHPTMKMWIVPMKDFSLFILGSLPVHMIFVSLSIYFMYLCFNALHI